ncbi:MAG: fatty acid CoA ligase family protein [Verrucomicrobia bacterium]|nr:fatty acid CoA ligase family protein [Verrucomicrobiota bacterium]MDA1067750.1 fatty acid CoA ligase family protein [Verrucomicrobiota bacterium]
MSFNIARFLPKTAAAQPDDCALKIPQGWEGEMIRYRSLSFSELESLSNACANLLIQRGIKRGTRVQLAVRPGLELILLTFALFKMGAVPVVIDPGMGRKHFLACVKRTRPEVLVGIPMAIWLSRLFWGSFKGVKTRIFVGGGFEKQLSKLSSDPIMEETRSDDLAAILFTSGSTGAPKGVLYEHGMFDAQVRLIGETYGIERGEIDLPMLPVFALFNPAFGMTTVVPEMDPSRPATVDPRNIVQAILQNGVTSSFGSPVLWGKICKYCSEKHIQLPSIKRVLMAGAPVPPSLIEAFKKVIVNGEIHTPYGATESLPVCSISGTRILEETMVKTNLEKGTCVGKAVSEMEVRVIAISDDAISTMDDAVPLPIGEIGELVVKGPVVTKGYDQLGEATAKAKIADGDSIWHRMGDTGYLDEQGDVWFCGRVAERVQTESGVLFTDPVEAYFNQQPKVFRSALIGLGEAPHQAPAIVIEPEKDYWTDDYSDHQAWEKELLANVPPDSIASKVEKIFFYKNFPVDVRHNAKIHRLTLAKKFS